MKKAYLSKKILVNFYQSTTGAFSHAVLLHSGVATVEFQTGKPSSEQQVKAAQHIRTELCRT